MDHLFLHCLLALHLWLRLFREIDFSLVIMDACVHLIVKKHKEFDGSKKAKMLLSCMAISVLGNLDREE